MERLTNTHARACTHSHTHSNTHTHARWCHKCQSYCTCTPPYWLWFVYMLFSCPHTLPSPSRPSHSPPPSPSPLPRPFLPLLLTTLSLFLLSPPINLSPCSPLWNYDSPFLCSPRALIQNPPFSFPFFPLFISLPQSPFSYFNPVILFSVRCFAAPMCEMYFFLKKCFVLDVFIAITAKSEECFMKK